MVKKLTNETGIVPKNPKAPPKRADEIKPDVSLEDLPIKDGPVKVVDVNGHTIILPDLEAAKQYVKHSGGKIVE